MNPTIRTATEDEEQTAYLALAMESLARFDPEEIHQRAEELEGQSVYAVDHYITGGPGYMGKVLLVHWDGSPDYLSVLTFDGDRIDVTSHGDGEPLRNSFSLTTIESLKKGGKAKNGLNRLE